MNKYHTAIAHRNAIQRREDDETNRKVETRQVMRAQFRAADKVGAQRRKQADERDRQMLYATNNDRRRKDDKLDAELRRARVAPKYPPHVDQRHDRYLHAHARAIRGIVVALK